MIHTAQQTIRVYVQTKKGDNASKSRDLDESCLSAGQHQHGGSLTVSVRACGVCTCCAASRSALSARVSAKGYEITSCAHALCALRRAARSWEASAYMAALITVNTSARIVTIG